MSVASLAESLTPAYLPAESVAAVVGGGSVFAIRLVAGVGMLAYINGYVPLRPHPLPAGDGDVERRRARPCHRRRGLWHARHHCG